jgi:hypothetical protein
VRGAKSGSDEKNAERVKVANLITEKMKEYRECYLNSNKG